MRYVPGIAAVVALVGCAAPAAASSAVATLEILGQVSPRCSIDVQDDTIDRVLTDGPGSESVPFSVDCNQPLVVNMQSLNGGFLHESGRRLSGSPGFITFLPYTTTLTVDAAGAAPVTFQSEQMVAGATGSIGVTPFKAKGELRLSWSPQSPLIGGAYRDIIEIRVSGEGETSSTPI
jgi:hypothetical protein